MKEKKEYFLIHIFFLINDSCLWGFAHVREKCNRDKQHKGRGMTVGLFTKLFLIPIKLSWLSFPSLLKDLALCLNNLDSQLLKYTLCLVWLNGPVVLKKKMSKQNCKVNNNDYNYRQQTGFELES